MKLSLYFKRVGVGGEITSMKGVWIFNGTSQSDINLKQILSHH